ncbi:MAG: hypothetical protein KBT70_18625 [Roseovarius sp.]|uniref:hypothetical protein n=1 Tax=Roseovarius sp. TaxID=1486281 RepID=UPI001B46843D|nr:hypothetical protein [Roseovarius sp.]MBQ0752213.1 hypothetical protein [Roseovarius sp.]MBQ0809772.1 hypothetical protein [Roseovarius sp.]
MPLVAASDFEGLPQQPEARWLQLRDLIEKRLDNGFDMNNGGYETYDLLEYVQILSVAAEELGIGALKEIAPGNVREDFDAFRASVAGLATRLSLRVSVRTIANSVALSRPTRIKVLSEIENLRAMIRSSELSETQKNKAGKQIDQLQIMVISERTDIARVGSILAIIGGIAVGTTSLLADLPPAIGTISALIGRDKLEEESEQALIEDSRKRLQIQDHRQMPNEENGGELGYESGDELPF